MNTQRVTLILPTELVEIAEREAKKQRITRHNYLANILISNFGEVRKDPNADKIKQQKFFVLRSFRASERARQVIKIL